MLRRIITALAVGIAALALVATPAVAQQYPGTPPIDVPPVVPPVDVDDDDVVNPPPPAVDDDDVVTPPAVDTETETETEPDLEVAGDVVTRTLPVTGGDLLGLAAMGAGAIALGGVLVARRRHTS